MPEHLFLSVPFLFLPFRKCLISGTRLHMASSSSQTSLFFCANAWQHLHRKSEMCVLRLKSKTTVACNFPRRGQRKNTEIKLLKRSTCKTGNYPCILCKGNPIGVGLKSVRGKSGIMEWYKKMAKCLGVQMWGKKGGKISSELFKWLNFSGYCLWNVVRLEFFFFPETSTLWARKKSAPSITSSYHCLWCCCARFCKNPSLQRVSGCKSLHTLLHVYVFTAFEKLGLVEELWL